MSFSKIILDASVILKIVISEEDSFLVEPIIRKHIKKETSIIVPRFWQYEIANVLRFSAAKFSFKKAQEKIKILRLLEFLEIHPDEKTINKTLQMTFKKEKIAFYDTLYHALALEQNALLITADKKYYNQAKSFGNIYLLKNFKPINK